MQVKKVAKSETWPLFKIPIFGHFWLFQTQVPIAGILKIPISWSWFPASKISLKIPFLIIFGSRGLSLGFGKNPQNTLYRVRFDQNERSKGPKNAVRVLGNFQNWPPSNRSTENPFNTALVVCAVFDPIFRIDSRVVKNENHPFQKHGHSASHLPHFLTFWCWNCTHYSTNSICFPASVLTHFWSYARKCSNMRLSQSLAVNHCL